MIAADLREGTVVAEFNFALNHCLTTYRPGQTIIADAALFEALIASDVAKASIVWNAA